MSLLESIRVVVSFLWSLSLLSGLNESQSCVISIEIMNERLIDGSEFMRIVQALASAIFQVYHDGSLLLMPPRFSSFKPKFRASPPGESLLRGPRPCETPEVRPPPTRSDFLSLLWRA